MKKKNYFSATKIDLPVLVLLKLVNEGIDKSKLMWIDLEII